MCNNIVCRFDLMFEVYFWKQLNKMDLYYTKVMQIKKESK